MEIEIVYKRLAQLEANGIMLDTRLSAMETNIQNLLTSSEKAITLASSASLQLDNINKRLDTVSSKLSSDHDEIIQLRITQNHVSSAIDILQKSHDILKNDFQTQVSNCQFSFKNSDTSMMNIRAEHSLFQQRVDQSLKDLLCVDTELRGEFVRIQEKIIAMENVKNGWNVLKVVGGSLVAALGGALLIREAYMVFSK